MLVHGVNHWLIHGLANMGSLALAARRHMAPRAPNQASLMASILAADHISWRYSEEWLLIRKQDIVAESSHLLPKASAMGESNRGTFKNVHRKLFCPSACSQRSVDPLALPLP